VIKKKPARSKRKVASSAETDAALPPTAEPSEPVEAQPNATTPAETPSSEAVATAIY
jgi:hypothetical protein